MKIAVITDTYFAVNGVCRTYQELAKYCQRKKIRLDIFTIGKTHHSQKLGSVNIYQFPALWPVKYYYDLPPFDVRIIPKGFKEKLLKTNYDIFHFATPASLGIAGRLILANSKKPKVGAFHTLVAEYASWWAEKNLEKFPATFRNPLAGFSQTAMWKFLKWFYFKMDVVLTPSLAIKSQLKILGRPVVIFPRGVDTELFDPKKKNPKLKEKLPIALYTGRLSIEKNLDLLVKIFKNKEDVKLWFCGDGPYKTGLKAQLPQAKFFGYQQGQKLAEIYASADFFVFPSTTDTFGNVILEAQACGLPTIVTDAGGPKELVKNKINGLIVKPKAKDFSSAIDFLAKNEKIRKTMGQKARANALKTNWPKAFDQLFSTYKKMCNKK
ncbi:MAG: glycosyltransferase family 1 protein [Candidatus Buchananbacteria bacterium]